MNVTAASPVPAGPEPMSRFNVTVLEMMVLCGP